MTGTAKIGEYPSKPALARAVAQARELGLEVAGFEIAPGGVIRVLGTAAFASSPPAAEPVEDEIARWRERKRR